MSTSDAAAQLHAQLEESLWNLLSSDDWLAALKTAAKFQATQIDPDLNVRIATLPESRDPADLVASGQADLLRKALAEAVPSVIDKIDRTLDRYNLDEPDSKWRAIRDVTATIVGVTNPDTRQAAVDHLATRVDWDPTVHPDDLDTYITKFAAFDQPHPRHWTAPGRVP